MSDELIKIRASITKIYLSLDEGEAAQIPITKNLCAIVDQKFEARVLQYRWFANVNNGDNVYAVANVRGQRISLQRLIKHFTNEARSIKDIKGITFRNKHSLDCRAVNLVEVTGQQSVMRNRRAKKTSSSQYKGVRKRIGIDTSLRWSASIRISEGDLFLGTYEQEKQAAAAYDAAAFLFFAGSANLNLPERTPSLDALSNASARYAKLKAKQKAGSN